MTPRASFIVPCYKTAHLLPDCINSILGQDFGDFEILIMDDCSPDNMAEVAASFNDPRVIYVRNEKNLGHLRNYNKGISLAKGDYVWMVSADDYLRRPYVLTRYVKFMDEHPRVGYVFSAGIFFENGKETRLVEDAWWGDRDLLFEGHEFFVRLYNQEAGIVPPSVMVRRECYEKVSMFPLDMPHQGDRYLWALWALTYNVAYFGEPMVAYRLHDLNIMKTLRRSRMMIPDILEWQSRIRNIAEESGYGALTKKWLENVSTLYAFCLLSERVEISPHFMSLDEFEESLRRHARNSTEERKVRARAYAGYADGCYRHGESGEQRRFYERALGQDFWMPRVWAKYLLLRSGRPGHYLRRLFATFRQAITRQGHATTIQMRSPDAVKLS